MPQFKFYFNDVERTELVSHILSKGAEIIPDILYNSKSYVPIVDVHEFMENLNNRNVGFFLLAECFVTEPLTFLDIYFDDGVKYKISQRVGGPYIDASFYLGYADDALLPHKYSLIGHYARFIHSDSSEEFNAPQELKSYYNDLVKYIKGKCKLVKKSGKSFWVSRQVLAENPIC